MHVKVDISENLKKIDCDSVLGVATDDGAYHKCVCLPSSVKQRIKNYKKYREEIHAYLLYILLKDELHKYERLHICPDVSKKSIHNNLLSLFKNNNEYQRLRKMEAIEIRSVGDCFVNSYVRNVRRGKLEADHHIKLLELQEILCKLRSYKEK